MNKIAYVVNNVDFLISHRLPILLAVANLGCEVHVIAPEADKNKCLIDHGFICHNIKLSRSGNNPISDFKYIINLSIILLNVKPDIVHLVTIKPVLYGGIVARLLRIPGVVAAVSGLGTVVLGDGLLCRARRALVRLLYLMALRHKRVVTIFQNPDDKHFLLNWGVLTEKQAYIIRGSGVNLTHYPFVPENSQGNIVVMASRLLKDKGIMEYVHAAMILKERGINVDMRLIGSPDYGNVSSVTAQDLCYWEENNIVTLLGYREDIAVQYSHANIVCLPSYREGLPKALIEAAACGRAVITTDVPGCRDAIEPGVTGMLVPVKDAVALANAILFLLEHPDKRSQLGEAGRDLAEREFIIEKIVDSHLAIYSRLLN